MTILPALPNSEANSDHRPLPLIVAQRWNFPLASHETAEGLVYAVQDWISGLTGETDTRYLLAKFKKTKAGKQTWNSVQRLKYQAMDGKSYQRDFTTDKGLYLIAQYLRVTQERPMLDEVRRFLAAAGAFVDEVRRDPNQRLESVSNPDKLLDAFIEYHRKRGKDDRWIQMRIDSKIKHNQFTAALAEFVRDERTPRHYATALPAYFPPSIGSTCPVIQPDSGAARNNAPHAMSSGVPRRRMAMASTMDCCFSTG